MKKILAVFLILAMIFTFSACGSEGAQTDEEVPLNEDGTLIEGYDYGFNFAYVVNYAPAEFFQNTQAMFAEELAKYGCGLELIGDAETASPEAEINLIQNAVASGNYNALFVYPADIAALTPACHEASEAGCPVIAYGVSADDGMGDVHFNVDNFEVGQKIAEMAIEWVEANADHFGDEVEVAIGWNYSNTEVQKRGEGEKARFEEENAKGGRQYVIVAEKETGTYEAGMEFGENLLASNPNCEIVVGHSDDPMLAVAEAWKAAGRDTTYCATFGMDATAMGYEAIAAGTGAFRGTINQSVEAQPPIVAEGLIKLALGQLKEGDMPSPPLVKVTAANISEYFAG